MPSVLITSANRGLGLEFAAQYLSAGWRVYAACRHPPAASELGDLAKRKAERITTLAMDVTREESVAAAAAGLRGQSIDLLINSAGIMGAPHQRTGHIDYGSWAEVLNVNTLGPMRVLEAFIEHLVRSDRKLAVTITSGMGSIADNTSGGSIAYRSSKAAVNMAMRSAAIDLRERGIACVVVNPGWVRTDMGGPNATLSVEASVTAMRKLIDTLGPAQSGKFFNYNGREYAW
jgi:NAD(P)-dependent dehydrogenase (short-subunit alcohol dehydrogenase family)